MEKADVIPNLLKCLTQMIKDKDQYTDLKWMGNHFKIIAKSGKVYKVHKAKLEISP